MNGWKRGVPDFARTRRALLAGLLGLGLVILWSGTVFALRSQTSQAGPEAFVDSATDDGGGRIRISWSLQSEPPEGYFFSNNRPDKVCVEWSVVENGVRGSVTHTCFTSEISSQSDLLVDTGIGADGPTTVYSLILVPYYYGRVPFYSRDDDGALRRTEVTLNTSS